MDVVQWVTTTATLACGVALLAMIPWWTSAFESDPAEARRRTRRILRINGAFLISIGIFLVANDGDLGVAIAPAGMGILFLACPWLFTPEI